MPNSILMLERKCPVCGKEFVIMMTEEGHRRWESGELIQDVFPELSPTEREQLMTGVCSDECWDDLWADYSDDE